MLQAEELKLTLPSKLLFGAGLQEESRMPGTTSGFATVWILSVEN